MRSSGRRTRRTWRRAVAVMARQDAPEAGFAVDGERAGVPVRGGHEFAVLRVRSGARRRGGLRLPGLSGRVGRAGKRTFSATIACSDVRTSIHRYSCFSDGRVRVASQMGLALKLFKYAVDFVEAVRVLGNEPAWPAHLLRSALWLNRFGIECVTLALARGLQPAQLERLVCCVCESLAVEPHALRSCAHCCCKTCLDGLHESAPSSPLPLRLCPLRVISSAALSLITSE